MVPMLTRDETGARRTYIRNYAKKCILYLQN